MEVKDLDQLMRFNQFLTTEYTEHTEKKDNRT